MINKFNTKNLELNKDLGIPNDCTYTKITIKTFFFNLYSSFSLLVLIAGQDLTVFLYVLIYFYRCLIWRLFSDPVYAFLWMFVYSVMWAFRHGIISLWTPCSHRYLPYLHVPIFIITSFMVAIIIIGIIIFWHGARPKN